MHLKLHSDAQISYFTGQLTSEFSLYALKLMAQIASIVIYLLNCHQKNGKTWVKTDKIAETFFFLNEVVIAGRQQSQQSRMSLSVF